MNAQPVITLLAGGVGGAKAALGLALGPHAERTRIIGNIADDEAFHGLWVSPDIDTLTYTLARRIHPQQGWGLTGDSAQVLNALNTLGADTWMWLGDMDFATHIYRTEQRSNGIRPSAIAAHIAEKNGVKQPIILPTDDVVQTRLTTDQGELSFQEYFVRERCAPEIHHIEFHGADKATATPEALAAIHSADLIVLAPSNPIVSIGAILAIPGIRDAIRSARAKCIAISPFIGGKTVKGPADKMLEALGLNTSPVAIAELYADILDGLMIDHADHDWRPLLEDRDLPVLVTHTLMNNDADKTRLMNETVAFYQQLQQEVCE
ncbi:2-phospho-L-lactate transferase [Thalassolituus sp. LLYu03]|uniref:2-phospho-L-lactate transferase n=1 Tax=Thalassolituus sp. LLYu03 TaxID=3421656 RepID=UPI003D291252